MDSKKLLRGSIAEFIGMMFFVWVGTGAVISTGEQLTLSAAPTAASVARVLPIAFAFGISITVQAYAWGHISGGHFNPAVTYCLFLINEVKLVQLVCYVCAQFSGAAFASLLLWGSVSALDDGRDEVGNPPFGLGANGLNPALNQRNGFVLELMGTLVLCMTVVMTAVHKKSLCQGVPNLAPRMRGAALAGSTTRPPFVHRRLRPASSRSFKKKRRTKRSLPHPPPPNRRLLSSSTRVITDKTRTKDSNTFEQVSSEETHQRTDTSTMRPSPTCKSVGYLGSPKKLHVQCVY